MEIYAFFIWPAVVFGVLIAYGAIVSRKPRPLEDRAMDVDLLAEFQRLEERIAEITAAVEQERVINEEQAAALRRIQPLRTGVFVRAKHPVRADYRAGRLTYLHGN